jgi:hypothetical protein
MPLKIGKAAKSGIMPFENREISKIRNHAL